jgi:hypothetical protein
MRIVGKEKFMNLHLQEKRMFANSPMNETPAE